MQASLVSRMTEHNADRDISVVKIFSLIAFTVFAAVISGFFILQSQWAYATVFLTLFWTAFTLQTLFIKTWKKIFIAISLETLAFALAIIITSGGRFSVYMLAALSVLLLSLLMAEVAARDAIKNALHTPFWRVAREALLKAVTGALVFTALAYIFLISPPSTVAGNYSDAVVSPIVRILNKDLSIASSTREVLKQIFLKTLSGDNLIGYESLSASQKTAALDAAATELFKSFAPSLGLTNINDPISKSVYDALQNKFFSLSPVARAAILLSLALSIWFTIRTIAFLLYLPLAFIVFIAYETLIALGFAIVQYESRSREIVILN